MIYILYSIVSGARIDGYPNCSNNYYKDYLFSFSCYKTLLFSKIDKERRNSVRDRDVFSVFKGSNGAKKSVFR